MRHTRAILSLLAGALAILAVCLVAKACDWWVVQGVIDWSEYYIPGKPATQTPGVYPIYQDGYPDKLVGWGWDQPNGNGNLKCFTANDGDILLPRPEQIDADVSLGILAGGVVLEKGPAADPGITVNWYEVWSWEDVNNNGLADPEDGADQNWKNLLEIGHPEINKAIDLVPSSLGLKSGKTYLLLIRASAGGKTNLQFYGGVALSWPNLSITDWADLGQEGWQSSGSKKYTANWSSAVENREVLWVRINNPPAKPVVP